MNEHRVFIPCVNYDDYLRVTLPSVLRHFSRVHIITSPKDLSTRQVAEFYRLKVFLTDAWYRDGADFNKGLAVEEALDHFGRHGWMINMDADVLLPEDLPDLSALKPGRIYCPRRRILDNVSDLAKYRLHRRDDFKNWTNLPIVDQEHAGYCHLYHADDPRIRDARPWYGTAWRTAGGTDSTFLIHWPPRERVWLDFAVLHLGPVAVNWCGRVSERLDGESVPGALERMARLADLMRQKQQAGQRHAVMRLDGKNRIKQ